MAEARRPDTTFWVDFESVRGERLVLDPEESHHLVRVHRAQSGTPFTAIDGVGTAYDCIVESVEGGRVSAAIVAREAERGELPFGIALLVGLPELGPAEAIVEHAVPLGATRIDFIACARSGRPAFGSAKLQRLERIARAGVKQSRRSRSPAIVSSGSLDEALQGLPPGPRLVADPRGPRQVPEHSREPQRMISLAVGPPGGFDPIEEGRLAGAKFQPISLGPSRLTTQTAAISVLVVARNSLLPKGLEQI